MTKQRHYTESREAPYCNYQYEHVPSTVHAKQLKDARDEADRLRVERDALKAQLGTRIPDLDRQHEELLRHLADALRTGELFGYAAPGAQVTDQTKTGRQKPKSDAPKGGDRHVRNALGQLVRSVDKALTVFESKRLAPAQERIDFDPGPKRRCWTRDCGDYSVTVPADHEHRFVADSVAVRRAAS